MPSLRCTRTVLVVDASVLVVALADDQDDGLGVRDRLTGEQLSAPELIDLEVLSVLRGHVRSGQVLARRAELALGDLQRMPLDRAPHRILTRRCWELRDNLTPYDAAYVALAEILDAPLLTGDRRLARATGPRCPIEVIFASGH